MALYARNNPLMDIAAIIASNLSAWMQANPALDTLQKLENRSGVGFGTVRRAKNGDANLTVAKLAAIAAAFGRTPADLVTPRSETGRDTDHGTITPPVALSPSSNSTVAAFAAESRAPYNSTRWPFPHVDAGAYGALTETGKVWVQARTASAIEEATRQFGTAAEKRPA